MEADPPPTLTTVVDVRQPDAKFDVYVGRRMRLGRFARSDGRFGNPYSINDKRTPEEAVSMFRAYFYRRLLADPEFKAAVLGLRGKALGCWCPPRYCHAEIIAEYLNDLET